MLLVFVQNAKKMSHIIIFLSTDSFSIKVTKGTTRISCGSRTNGAGFDGGSGIPAVSAISVHHASHQNQAHLQADGGGATAHKKTGSASPYSMAIC